MSNLRQYTATIPAGAGNTDTTVLNGVTVTSVHYIKTALNGGAGDTVQLNKLVNGAGLAVPISTVATAIAVNDTITVGPDGVSISDATSSIGAADTIRFTTAQVADCSCTAVITGIPNTV